MIETPRLILREWRDSDIAPFHDMTRDPDVMAHLGGVQSATEADAMIARVRATQAARGHCFWAIERRDDAAFLGFCGLRIGGHAGTPVIDELEIGWRLARPFWGRGYALEAARASIAWGWANTRARRIAAWTVPANTPSWGLMLRLGMTHRSDLDFDHPGFPAGHPLSRHLVYAIDRPAHD